MEHLDKISPGGTESEITGALADLETCIATLNEVAPRLHSTLSTVDARTLQVSLVAELSTATEIVEHLATGGVGDLQLLLDALADGLAVLGYPPDEPLVRCRKRNCRRVVPYGARYCCGCSVRSRRRGAPASSPGPK